MSVGGNPKWNGRSAGRGPRGVTLASAVKLTHLPLLAVQRDLYRLPRGMERFREYLRTMTDPRSGDLALPIVSMNPMGKEHVAAQLDRLIEIGAEDAASRAIQGASRQLEDDAGEYRVALVLSDDAKGGWTNRASTEFGARFQPHALTKRGFVVVMLWTSESYDAERVRRETLAQLHRIAWIGRLGEAKTLAEMMAQEGHALRCSGAAPPALDARELARTRDVIAPCLARGDMPTAVAALFGDEAAASLGFATLGLGRDAGLSLALADALSSAASSSVRVSRSVTTPRRERDDRRPRR